MIDRSSITAWGVAHPWPKKNYVEQDLIICRAIVAIFSDPLLSKELAWRGGTALHKLYLMPQARYSEDIDLVRIGTGPVKPIIERLDEILKWLPNKSFEQRRFGFRMKFRYESEMPPVEPMRLKVEANTFEHFSELPLSYVPFSVESPYFTGSCSVTTYELDELLGTKLRAMYQRKKVRDLFDMDYALGIAKVDASQLLRCWRKYMSTDGHLPPTRREFIENMNLKMASPDYLNDMQDILRPGVVFDPRLAFQRVQEQVLNLIDTVLFAER